MFHPCPFCGHHLTQPLVQTFRGPAHYVCAQRAGALSAPSVGSQIGKLVGIGAAVAFALLVVVFAIVTNRPRTEAPAKKAPAPVAHQVAAEWTKDSTIWEAIVVPRGTSDAQICELAKWLHREKWLARFQVFDEGARVQEYVAWTKAYPSYQRPPALVSWMGTHHRGIVVQATPDTWEFRNVIADSPGALRSSFPCSFPR